MADQKEEKWEGIKGFSNYEISNKGRIRSKTRKSWHKGSQVYMKIKDAMFDFDKPEFRRVSDEAKDLIKHLLVQSIKYRFSAEDALTHPWFTIKND